MKTRMQPIGNIWSKFPRTVRDLVVSCGKDVRIEMEGQETELDKTIIEAIKDPLMHLVRNAVDHGIELPEERRKAGKDAVGCLTLRAFHEGGQVNIEISDDGGGLDVDRIRQKAIERGLIGSEQARRMSERDIFRMIFLPGFSTAEKVTNVSGRGVGMDVVRSNVEKISGSVDVQSVAGKGTTVRIKIPLTLAIIPALVVTSAEERYAIPQLSLVELIRLEGEQARAGIEMIHDVPVYRLRGQLLPLVFLERELKKEEAGKGAISNELPDFVVAREKHRHWLGRLRDVLDNKTAMTLADAGCHQECALGKWLYGSGLKAYLSIPEIHHLEKTHRSFHEAVRAAVASKLNGQAAQAGDHYAEVVEISRRVVELIELVEKRALEASAVNIVVLQADGRLFGLVVDGVSDTEEIVVKPLRKQLKHIKTFAGASVMGDGRIALILDVAGLAQRANVIGDVKKQRVEEASMVKDRGPDEKHSYLLFTGPNSARMAVPLETVARLEELPTTKVEKSGNQWLAQYRGGLLPLVDLTTMLKNRGTGRRSRELGEQANGNPLQVLVCHHDGKTVGLVVEHILDVIEERAEVRHPSSRRGVLCSAVLAGQVTELVDVPVILQTAAVASNPAAKAAEGSA